MLSKFATTLALTLLAATAFAQTSNIPSIVPTRERDQEYRKLYPLFMDGCSAGQKVGRDGDAGMAWGHGVLYIRGVSLDKSQGYPRLVKKLNGPNNEFGVSANGQFSNLNWVAIPKEELFFYGDIKPNQTFTHQDRENLIQRMIGEGWFAEVKSERWPEAQTEEAKAHAILNEAIPIDVGVTLGRETYCQRVPINEKQLDRVIDYLNERNKFYFVDGNKYEWKFMQNNCGHLANNAFSAAGLLPFKRVDSNYMGTLQNLVIPSNFIIDLVRATSYNDVPSFTDVLNSSKLTKNLLELDILPTVSGSLTRYLPVHGYFQPELNQVYDPRASSTKFVDLKIFNRNTKVIGDARVDARYSELKANLEHFKTMYEKELNAARKINIDRFASRRGGNTKAVYSAYVHHVEAKLREIDANLR